MEDMKHVSVEHTFQYSQYLLVQIIAVMCNNDALSEWVLS